MTNKQRLKPAVQNILIRVWDPVRIQELREAFGVANEHEYDRYVDAIVDLISSGASERDIEEYLRNVEVGQFEQKLEHVRSGCVAKMLIAVAAS